MISFAKQGVATVSFKANTPAHDFKELVFEVMVKSTKSFLKIKQSHFQRLCQFLHMSVITFFGVSGVEKLMIFDSF